MTNNIAVVNQKGGAGKTTTVGSIKEYGILPFHYALIHCSLLE